ncbi:TetR/AcrR family transcriptional regulator [Paractinoplanes durhamensis]|uniref:TetR family transcriptional regulator n=1 Tax=Paractinoplanes durhamensis TaxID=113563 RepID=A0ABQ3YSK7_9ACTN|nr:TetR/AcrR family transcriptional regulator [Actinoplanes durhamensis]GIE00359.1 TetR family transcriptional regulator [Actinoplanes durhamensis]
MSDNSARPRGGRPRRAGVGAAVRQAAEELIAERGYAGTTLDLIAQRAGVAKTTVYRRWRSKSHLAIDTLADLLGDPPAGIDLLSPITWLAAQVREPSVRRLLVGLVGEAGQDESVRAELRARIREPFTRHLVDEFGLSAPDVDLAFDVVVGALLHRLAMTGELTDTDALAVTDLATRLVFGR